MNKLKINLKNIVICMIDEWCDGSPSAFDCNIQRIDDNGIHVLYLSGYRSRNDFVPWKDIRAVVDKRRKWVELRPLFSEKECVSFSGNFRVII